MAFNCFIAASQPILPTTIAAMRAAVNTQFTTATSFHSITHVTEGKALDTIWASLGILSNAIASSSGNLETVTMAGNSTDQGINITGASTISLFGSTGYSGQRSYLNYNSLRQFNSAGTYASTISAGTLTGNRGYLWPDEGNSIGLASTLMLHTTMYPLLITSGSNASNFSQYIWEITNGIAAFGVTINGLNSTDGIGNSFQGSPSGITVTDPTGNPGFKARPDSIFVDNGFIRCFMDSHGQTIGIGASGSIGSIYAGIGYAGTLGSGTGEMSLTQGASNTFNLSANSIGGVANCVSPPHNGTLATDDGGLFSHTVSSVTSVTVTHSLGWTPSRILITPVDATTGAALTGYWVSTITSTTFVVNFPLFTGTLTFDWQAF